MEDGNFGSLQKQEVDTPHDKNFQFDLHFDLQYPSIEVIGG